MPYYDIITLIGFGFGVALAIILFSLSLQRMPQRSVDIASGILFLSIVLWLGGNFLSILSYLLFGPLSKVSVKFFLALAYVGLAITPSALLDMQVASLLTARGAVERLNIKQKFLLLLFHIPALVFILAEAAVILTRQDFQPGTSQIVSTPFTLWLILAITASVTLSEKLVQTLKFDADRRFYRDISYVLAAIGLGVIIVYVFSFSTLPYIGRYLDLFMLLSPTIPMAVFLYYVYRYNFYRLVVKPSLVYSIIYGSVMAIYLLGIRRFGEYLKQYPEVNAEIVEGLLLIALVFAFQPFRSILQARLDKIFFKDRYYYQQFLREMSDSISGIVDLELLLQNIRKALASTLKVQQCSIVIFQHDGKESSIIKSSGTAQFVDVSMLIDALQATRHFRLRRQSRDLRVVSAFQHNKIALAVPIYFQDEMRGLICLEEKVNGNTFSDEELDVLQTFANQISLAVENARLVQERVELIGRIYQAEKVDSLGQLATTMSHEIKNPLSSIKTIVQVLHENASGEEKQDLNLVVQEIDRLNSILEKLLSFARPAEAIVEHVDVAAIIEDVLSLLRHQARKNNITLEFKADENVPGIKGKLQSVREIVLNLLLNAIQAQPDGGSVDVHLMNSGSVHAGGILPFSEATKDYLILQVSDQGPGIPDELLEKIYEPFYTSKTVGTGLGLAIVKRNIEALNGKIWAENIYSGGAEFTVYLPVAD
jgi:signal transduction histidine kinase